MAQKALIQKSKKKIESSLVSYTLDQENSMRDLTSEELKELEDRIKAFIDSHPGAPPEVISFLTRPGNVQPYVDPKEKIKYLNNYAATESIMRDFARPHKITKVNSIEEAIQISLDDMKKSGN